ncbi:MAG: DUF4956 domain-containing protein [Bacteroidetes bacterium]|nr:DUF4956 domain-containing protein [Bacteroidota bacterium]MBP6722730.1 DUF4956 domain-containing protein [Bacteroidia bacterium]
MDIGELTEQAVNPLASVGGLWEFLIRFGFNLIMIFVIVIFVYYRNHKNKDFVFTYFLFNIINFLICFLLSTAKLKMGFAFGLFAIYSILRYRTVTIPVREMGFFFVAVTLGIINALASLDNFYVELISANLVLVALTFILDGRFLPLKHENHKDIIYDRIDLIHPDRRPEMMNDLKARTGLNIHRVEFIKIDFMRDVARIHAFYFSDRNESPNMEISSGDSDD